MLDFYLWSSLAKIETIFFVLQFYQLSILSESGRIDDSHKFNVSWVRHRGLDIRDPKGCLMYWDIVPRWHEWFNATITMLFTWQCHVGR